MKAIIWSVLLEKAARHIGLIACLCILFNASGHTKTSSSVVLLLVAGASVLHLMGKSFKRPKLKKQMS